VASVVLDSSVILAHIGGELGSERAAAFFGDALISAVNLAEVVGKLVERGISLDVVRQALSLYGLQVVPFDEELAERTGGLRPQSRSQGLSLGDRACLALALRAALPVLTADRGWKDLNLPVEVELLR
jgi:ribonuclease VapC